MNVVRDDTMAVAGFEHHTYMCSDCKDVERRLVFAKPLEPADPQPVPVHAAPSISPAVIEQSQRKPAPGLLHRVLARLRGGSDS